jgi:hypothetical protein
MEDIVAGPRCISSTGSEVVAPQDFLASAALDFVVAGANGITTVRYVVPGDELDAISADDVIVTAPGGVSMRAEGDAVPGDVVLPLPPSMKSSPPPLAFPAGLSPGRSPVRESP